jgi:hypothetical protein
LRKFIRNHPKEAQKINIYILSAEYGLISAKETISYYDRKMTPQRASTLKRKVFTHLEKISTEKTIDQLFIHAGQTYLDALGSFQDIFPDIETKIPVGPPGSRLSALWRWLRIDLETFSGGEKDNRQIATDASIRGKIISNTPEQIFEVARKALTIDKEKSANFHSRYVEIDDRRVAPKWLVSQLTDLPVRRFHTNEAIRVLERLGIEVHYNHTNEEVIK